MRSVVDRNVVMRHIPVCTKYKTFNIRISNVSLVFTIRWRSMSVCGMYIEAHSARDVVEEAERQYFLSQKQYLITSVIQNIRTSCSRLLSEITLTISNEIYFSVAYVIQL
jgi:hypothetical protein